MVLNVEEQEIIDYIGHDGSEIIFPNLKEPECRRGFHIQELIDFTLSKDKSVIEIEGQCVQGPMISEKHTYFLNTICGKHPVDRINDYMNQYSGILYGWLIKPNVHAVVWDHKRNKVLDPNGRQYGRYRFNILSFYIVK